MRAAVVHAFNAPPSYTEFADPVPSAGEVAVTVTVAGLHRIVRALAGGSHYGSTGELPFIPGVDGVGRLSTGERISLDQARDALVAAFQREHAHTPINVVLDYLWGQPAECAIAAIAQRGLSKAAPRVRFIQIGNSAAANISLPAAALRSSGLELLGSGFGSASLEQLRAAIADFFASAAREPFHFEVETAPLSEIEARWNTPEGGKRLVFVP